MGCVEILSRGFFRPTTPVHAGENPIARLKGRDLGANLKNFARDLRTGRKGTWRFALVLSGDDKACCEANTGRAYAIRTSSAAVGGGATSSSIKS